MRRSDSPQLQVCELACPSPVETGRTQTATGTMQLLRTPTRNDPYRFTSARQDSSPLLYHLLEPSLTAHVGPVASSSPARSQDTDKDKQTTGLPAGTIVAIIFSGLILIFLLTGVYAYASSRPKSRRDWRGLLGRRSHCYEDDNAAAAADDDIEMQTPRRAREPLLEQQQQHQQDPHHREGAGMGYDDDEEDGREAWIEVGTAQVARIRRVPAGTVSITNIGRGKAPAVPLGASQSVRDVFSLPDLAWAETLTTGGGRRPGAMVPVPIPARLGAAATATATATTSATTSARASARATATGTARPVSSSKSSSSSSVQTKKGLQERSESRRAVKRKAIREWCARGSGGGLGPYSAAY